MLRGRTLTDADRQAMVAVINEGAAKQSWPGLDPHGRHFKRGDTEYTVVGVVADTRSNALRDAPIAMAFYPCWDNVHYGSFFLVRTQKDPKPSIRK